MNRNCAACVLIVHSFFKQISPGGSCARGEGRGSLWEIWTAAKDIVAYCLRSWATSNSQIAVASPFRN